MFMCIIYTWGVLSTNLGPVFPPFFLLAGIQIQGTTLQIGDDAPIEKAGHEGGAEERGNLPGLIRFLSCWTRGESTKKVSQSEGKALQIRKKGGHLQKFFFGVPLLGDKLQ